jgi:hypothetical protein
MTGPGFVANLSDVFSASWFDAFGRLRTSESYTIFDSKLLKDKAPLYTDEIVSGVGASSVHEAVNANVLMTVTNNGEYAIRQTKMHFNYQPSKSQLIFKTFNLNPQAGTVKREGLFVREKVAPYNPKSGFFLEADGLNVSIVLMKNGVVTKRIARADWTDSMDGDGASHVNIDFSKAQILFFDYEWLGVGDIRFGFVVNHTLNICHIIKNANQGTTVYTETPNLPLSSEIRSTGGAGALRVICSAISSEAGHHPIGLIRGIDNGTVAVSVGAPLQSVLAIRLKQTHLDATIELLKASLMCTSTGSMRWILTLNPTMGGTAFVWTDITDSSLQFSKTAGALVTAEGTNIAAGYISPKMDAVEENLSSALKLGSKIDGTADILVLACSNVGAGSESIYGCLTVKEII